MKQTLLFAALGLSAFGAAAQEVGNVLSSVPVIQQVAVPRTYCNQPTTTVYEQPTTGAGGVMGAIAGAGIGNQIGSGSGHAAAILIGTIGGAILGNQIEAGGARQAQTQQVCGTETSYENRTVGYNVTYEYAGRHYTVQMPYDPGPTIRLNVSPVGAGGPTTPPPQQATGPVIAPPIQQSTTVVQPAPQVIYQPAPVIYQTVPAYPAYPVYAPYPVYRPYWPVGVSLNFGFHRHRHHGHRHHRH